jgi:hypothetical protein
MEVIMAYRNGTYIAFYAEGTNVPTESDIKYYNLLKAWKVREENDFYFINSHDKTNAVRDTSKKETLRKTLITRLNNSKNMILIIGKTTKNDKDWVPFEIEYAIDKCQIPIIAAYVDYEYILTPEQLSDLWPQALKDRIYNESARVIHIPFKEKPLTDAISRFDFENLPENGLVYYGKSAYIEWGIIKSQ